MAVLHEQFIDQPGTNQILHKITELSGLVELSAATLKVMSILADNSRNSVLTVLKFWNLALASVTFGVTPPHMVVVIGPSVSGNANADGKQEIQLPVGLEFTVGCTVAATLLAAKANTAAPSNQFNVEIGIDS